MYKYTKMWLNLLCLFLSIPIFIFSNFIEENPNNALKNVKNNLNFFKQVSFNKPIQINFGENIKQEKPEKEIKEETKQVINDKTKNEGKALESNYIEEYDWAIYIPKINLLVQIEEGTTNEIMDRAVGHFEETPVIKGNIGLAAHNRGYKENFFKDIKLLKKGDEIVYKKANNTKKYVVNSVLVIKDTDWTYLENTDENKITLITCVENEPEYRRCIQGVEIKKEKEKEKEENDK